MSKISSNNSYRSIYKSHKAMLIFILQLEMGKNFCCRINPTILCRFGVMTLAVVLEAGYTARWIISLFFMLFGLIS